MTMRNEAEGECRVDTEEADRALACPPVERHEFSRQAMDIQRFVARRVGRPEDAEDVVQQTLVRGYERTATFRGENPRAWLLTIARHLTADYYRAHFRFESVKREAERYLAGRNALDTVRAACECRERLEGCLGCVGRQLRLEEQVAVLLADFYGYADKESAVTLRMPVPSFKLLLHNARRLLHQAAGGSCPLVSKAGRKAPCAVSAGSSVNPPLAVGSCARSSDRVGCRLNRAQLGALHAKLVDGLRSADVPA